MSPSFIVTCRAVLIAASFFFIGCAIHACQRADGTVAEITLTHLEQIDDLTR